jgi:hypothetical protein
MTSVLYTLWSVFWMFGWLLIILYVFLKERKDNKEMKANLDAAMDDLFPPKEKN